MNEKPDTIEIAASAETEVAATSADIDLEVDGSSIFTGNEAFKKARELRELFEILTAVGLAADQMTIQGIRLSSDALLGWKSSSCCYSVRIRKAKSDILPQVLGSIAAKKGVTITKLFWRFETLETELPAIRERAMADLLSKARQSAALLGVEILGVHSFRETILSPESERRTPIQHGSWETAKALRGQAGPPVGVSLSSRASATLTVQAEFRVSTFPGA